MTCLMQSAGKDWDYWWIWTVQSRNPEEWTGGAGGYTIWEGTVRNTWRPQNLYLISHQTFSSSGNIDHKNS